MCLRDHSLMISPSWLSKSNYIFFPWIKNRQDVPQSEGKDGAIYLRCGNVKRKAQMLKSPDQKEVKSR